MIFRRPFVHKRIFRVLKACRLPMDCLNIQSGRTHARPDAATRRARMWCRENEIRSSGTCRFCWICRKVLLPLCPENQMVCHQTKDAKSCPTPFPILPRKLVSTISVSYELRPFPFFKFFKNGGQRYVFYHLRPFPQNFRPNLPPGFSPIVGHFVWYQQFWSTPIRMAPTHRFVSPPSCVHCTMKASTKVMFKVSHFCIT